MLGIILGVLKLLGILLLLILIMILFLGICVLFYPISYCFQGEIKGEAKGKIVIRWLFGMVRLKGSYQKDTGFLYGIYLLLFKIYPREEKKKRIEKKSKKASGKREKSGNGRGGGSHIAESSVVENNMVEARRPPKESACSDQAKDAGRIPEIETIKVQEKEEKTGFLLKLRGIYQGVVKKIQGVIKKIQEIGKNIKNALSEIEKFSEFVQSKEFKDTLCFLKEQKRYLVRHIAPKKCVIEAKYGTGDPASTGEILAILSVVRTFIPGHWRIYPDFENVLFEGNACIKGRFPLYVIFLVVYRCYRNDMIKEIYRKFD